MSSDRPGDLQSDLEKMQSYSGGGGMDTSLPAIAELVLLTLTGLVGVSWLVALLWVPDTIPSNVWMMSGALGMLLFGVPAGGLYLLRRGGVETIGLLVRDMVG